MIEDLWYKNAIIYSLDLETFMDGNGDGCGDFEGLSRRLDYLESLGVDTIWLAPFQPTPNRDNGYDVADFYGVDQRHGSSGEFVDFMHQAGKRGMGVIMDLVVNHTSDQHPWFQKARRGDPRYKDWYIWSKQRPRNWNKGMVFPGVQKAVWTRDEKAGEYYHHRFYNFQPDLNMDNPDVRTEIRRIMGYWLQQGVAGFRVDAVPFILEQSPLLSEQGEPKKNFEWLHEMRRFLQWRSGNAVLLGEANVLPKESRKYFGENADGLQMMFNFYVNQHLFFALASGDVRTLQRAIEQTRDLPQTAQWAQFLRNHDELDLGRLSERQRERVFEAFGPEEHMQVYHRGIRRRLAPMLGDRLRVELAYSLLFSLPGAAVIRYGDEIGMGDDLSLPEREAVRTPMQWSADRHAGFSAANRIKHRVIADGPYGYRQLNVEAQRRDPNSLLNWMVRLIRARKECPEIGWGDWQILDTEARSVLAMRYRWREHDLIAIHNMAPEPCEVSLALPEHPTATLVDLLSDFESRPQGNGKHTITLGKYGYRWLRAGGFGYGLHAERARR